MSQSGRAAWSAITATAVALSMWSLIDGATAAPRRLLRRAGEVPQDVVQDAAVLEILELGRRIDAAAHRESSDAAVRGAVHLHDQLFARGEVREATSGTPIRAAFSSISEETRPVDSSTRSSVGTPRVWDRPPRHLKRRWLVAFAAAAAAAGAAFGWAR